MSASVIHADNLCKSFDGKIAVDHVSLDISRGEIYGFLGPNGSGKTTTIRMLCGLLTPDSGGGTCLGLDLLKDTQKIKEKIGYMTQQFSLYQDLSILENLDFAAHMYGIANRKEKLEQTLHALHLYDKHHQLTQTLSGGWKQRLALSVALLHAPELLLLDEPTAGVDPKARREFWDHIQVLSKQGVTILVSTHYMDEAERCTQLAFLNAGKILAQGSADDLLAQSGLPGSASLEDVFVELLT